MNENATDTKNTKNTKDCPYCGEDVIATAKKCKHCGEILDVVMRDMEQLKKGKSDSPMVFMNAGGGGGGASAASAASSNGNNGRIGFPHMRHLIFTLLTGGLWGFVWFFLYFFRDKSRYY